MSSRREFLKGCAGCAVVGPLARVKETESLIEARYWQKLSGNRIQCHLCPKNCIVGPGQRGHCEVRENRDGTYYSLIYGKIAVLHNDPIEKKPFYHVLPGSSVFSMATAGCNVDCKFCQNWELAQRRPEELPFDRFTPQSVAEEAPRWKSPVIAFTYSEPTVNAEFIVDTAAEARKKGLHTVVVSNGYINEEPLRDITRSAAAYKVDLKAFDEAYYRDVVNATLGPVLDTLVRLKEWSVWTEIVYLVVPTLNDKDEDLKRMARWILENLGPDVPIHFSRFYPMYRLTSLPPTPLSTLERARSICLDSGLHFVYLGNVPGHVGENTVCPSCGALLIGRIGYEVTRNNLVQGRCGKCKTLIPGIWDTQ